jgi:hypothetical protein
VVIMAQQHPPPYYPPPMPPPPRRRSNVWKWVLAIVGLLVLLCGGVVVACTALIGKGINDAVEDDKARADANRKSCEGRSYPDQQPANDRCADAAGAVVLDEVRITATAIKAAAGSLCTDVAYTNSSDHTISFNMFDWKLQVPTGEVKDAFDTTGGANRLGSGDLVKGGTKSGTVCFEAAGSGQFVLIYKPSFWNDDRGIWVNTV